MKLLKFFRRNATLVAELRGQLSTAEQKKQALQTEIQHERAERAALERALQEAKLTSRSIQEEMEQKTTKLQAEVDSGMSNMKEITESMLKSFAQQEERLRKLESTLSQEKKRSHGLQEETCRLQSARDEAINTSKILQDKLELQNQLKKNQSEDLEKSEQRLQETQAENKCLQEMVEKRNGEIAKSKAELVQMKVNLEKEQQVSRNVLNQMSIIQEELKKKNHLQHELDLKQEENTMLERELKEKTWTVTSQEQVISNLQQEIQSLKEKAETVSSVEEEIISLQGEVQALKETCTKSVEEAKWHAGETEKEKQKNQKLKFTLTKNSKTITFMKKKMDQLHEDIQTLRDLCKDPGEAEVLMEEIRLLDGWLREANKEVDEQSVKLQEKDLLIQELQDKLEKQQ